MLLFEQLISIQKIIVKLNVTFCFFIVIDFSVIDIISCILQVDFYKEI